MRTNPSFDFLRTVQHNQSAAADTEWGVDGSSFADYCRRAYFPQHPGGLRAIIEAGLSGMENAVGADIAGGSDAVAVRNLVDSGVLCKALVTNFEDTRPAEVVADTRISHISGDLTHKATLQNIGYWRERHAPEGFALVMHRPVGGLQRLPDEFYKGGAHFLLDMIRGGGLMFTQIPRSFGERSDALSAICKSIGQRRDVAGKLLSRPRRGLTVDDRDVYALIVKKSFESRH